MVERSDDRGPEPEVIGFDQTEGAGIETDRWVDLAQQTLIGEGVQRGRLDLIFVDAEEMADLNRTHMGHDGPTDVLSFPLDAVDGVDLGPDGGTPVHLGDIHLGDIHLGDIHLGDIHLGDIHLGDIVVCPSVAERQAPDHCGTVEAELSLLIVHGVLHVLGHDHVERAETEAMQARERHHLARLGFAHPVPA